MTFRLRTNDRSWMNHMTAENYQRARLKVDFLALPKLSRLHVYRCGERPIVVMNLAFRDCARAHHDYGDEICVLEALLGDDLASVD
jgi:hypothetical protein